MTTSISSARELTDRGIVSLGGRDYGLANLLGADQPYQDCVYASLRPATVLPDPSGR